jgi:ParB family transcriptional regulator, chromosome partitioning protein
MSTAGVAQHEFRNNGEVTLVQDIPLNKIAESKTNPRRRFDELKLRELTENVRAHGVLQPILVRPLSNGKADRYELVAGARRYRASKAAGRGLIPARVVSLTDTEALEIQCIENLLREDIHELDEAEGYAKLLALGKDYTADVIALKVGKSRQYVHGRLQLLKLEAKLKDSFYEGHMNVAVALRLARLQPANQLAAFKYFQGNGQSGTEFTATVRDVDEWIKREVFLNLDSAAFKKDDASLYPEAGPCTTCPKRTGASPLLFPDLQQKLSNTCSDPACFKVKVERFIQLQVKQNPDAAKITSGYLDWQRQENAKRQGVISEYTECREGACPHTVKAVVVVADNHAASQVGTTKFVCANKECPTHGRPRHTITPADREKRRKELEAQRIQQEYRRRLLEEVCKRVPDKLERHEFGFVALRYFDQLGYDNQHRIFKFLRWEVPKSNGSYTGSVDYPKLASPKLDAMTAAALGKFLMVCALASDLYSPPYACGEGLRKDSKLARAAAHYKISGERILRELKERPTRQPAKSKDQKAVSPATPKVSAKKP